MYYKIDSKDSTKLDLSNSYIMMLSFDGSELIIFSKETPINYTTLETFEYDSDILNLMNDPFWKQPCSNC